jgi:DNA-binding SARP family transcriptional activator
MDPAGGRVKAGVVATKVRVPDVPSMGLDRLDARLDQVWNHRVGLIVAAAGSGKTSLLARFAARAPGPVGWYRAEGWDSDEASLVRHLEAALAPSLPRVARRWQTVADVANALAGWRGEPILLVVDDLHTLEGTPAEAALERLIEYAPPALTIVAASRIPPRFNLPRLRVSDALLELSGDDLRFRSWEVERLFRDFYEEPLPPEELARLARRTEGWAAGLQLFHLATRGRPAEERRRMLSELGVSSRLAREMRDYLARNVLDQLPANLRQFLVETSVLGRLSGPLCDRLLGRTDSREILEELERRRLFTHRLGEDGSYRYHEILRSHLVTVLLEEVEPQGLRERFCAAGDLLVESGALPEAVEAYCRGEDWERVSRLLGHKGREVADEPSGWLDALPAAIVSNDPWLLLANARRLRADGSLQDSSDVYRRAEAAFGSSDAASMCRTERQALGPWLDGASLVRPERSDPSALLRAALTRDPLAAAREAELLATTEGEVVAGLGALVGGHVARARRDLLHAAERADLGRNGQVVAALGAGVAGLLMGQRHATVEVEGAVAAAEEAGFEWIARLGRATLALSGSEEAVREAAAVAVASHRVGDPWGEAVARLVGAWGSAIAGRPIDGLEELFDLVRSLEAGTLSAWAAGLAAVAANRGGEADARDAAVAAEATARSMGVPAASLWANLAFALAAGSEPEADEYRSAAAAIARETGLLEPELYAGGANRAAVGAVRVADVHRGTGRALDGASSASGNGSTGSNRGNGAHAAEVRLPPIARGGPPPLVIRLLGGFELRLDGRAIDLSAIRPRVRALLRLLSLNAGTGLHHETIEAALWPEAEAEAGSRNLHVAIASLRRALEPTVARGAFQLLRRDGDAYRLVLPARSEVDLLRFEQAVATGRSARERSDDDGAARAFQEALDLYRGDLLPEDGPAEWVADRRDVSRLAAVDAAEGLAEILLARGDRAGAAAAASAGLLVERYHDPLWRILIRARDEAGDQGAASRARLGYDRMLAELGVEAAPIAT